METGFSGRALRLARLYAGLSLEQVAERVGKTRQFLHKLETAQSVPTAQLLVELAAVLRVEADFFFGAQGGLLAEEQIHFRKLFTTRASIKQTAMAKAEITGMLISTLEKRLKLPAVRVPMVSDAASIEEVECAAELCRREWGVGVGPIADMTRMAECVGAVVTCFSSISAEIDAMSFEFGRPIIVRNIAKRSACRQRFDIAHELGHFVLHSGRQTGDHTTEMEANRFASALLVPRSMMFKLFPRSRGQRLDWIGLSEFKRTWKISKAALLYRARSLDLLSEDQYKSGAIHLKRTGQANGESEDETIAMESPTLLKQSFELLSKKRGVYGSDIAHDLLVQVELLQDLVDFPLPIAPAPAQAPSRPTLRLVA